MNQARIRGSSLGLLLDSTAPFHPGFAGKSPSAIFGATAAPGGQCCILRFGTGCREFRHGSWAFPKIFNGNVGMRAENATPGATGDLASPGSLPIPCARWCQQSLSRCRGRLSPTLSCGITPGLLRVPSHLLLGHGKAGKCPWMSSRTPRCPHPCAPGIPPPAPGNAPFIPALISAASEPPLSAPHHYSRLFHPSSPFIPGTGNSRSPHPALPGPAGLWRGWE